MKEEEEGEVQVEGEWKGPEQTDQSFGIDGEDEKHRENREKLPREHLIGCQGVKILLVKDPFKFVVLN